MRTTSIALLATLALSTAAFTPDARAEGIITSVDACQPLKYEYAHDIVRTGDGWANKGSAPLAIWCPIVRPARPGAAIYIDGEVNSNATLSCTVVSKFYNGSFSSIKSISITGPANSGFTSFDKLINLSEQEAPLFSYQTLSCALPGNWQGSFRGYMVFTK